MIFKPDKKLSYQTNASPIIIRCLKTGRIVYFKPNVKGEFCKFNIPFKGYVKSNCDLMPVKKIKVSYLTPLMVLKKYPKEQFYPFPKSIPTIKVLNNKNKGTIYPLKHEMHLDKELKEKAPFAAVKFIAFHELAHYFYKTEKYCDLFACACLLYLGYNTHDCLFVLGHILKKNDVNFNRYAFCFNELKKYKYE